MVCKQQAVSSQVAGTPSCHPSSCAHQSSLLHQNLQSKTKSTHNLAQAWIASSKWSNKMQVVSKICQRRAWFQRLDTFLWRLIAILISLNNNAKNTTPQINTDTPSTCLYKSPFRVVFSHSVRYWVELSIVPLHRNMSAFKVFCCSTSVVLTLVCQVGGIYFHLSCLVCCSGPGMHFLHWFVSAHC